MPVSYARLRWRSIAFGVLFLSIEVLSSARAAFSQATAAVRTGEHFDHVVIVVMENMGTRQALADTNIAALAKRGAWFSNYRALAHPSLPNYLAMVGGSMFDVVTDHRLTPINAPTIADRLEEKGLTWKAYAEDYPGHCFLGEGAGEGRLTPKARPTELYAKKHVPLLAFKSIQKNPARCARVVNAREFIRDARSGQLPNYSFYSPNMFNDGHDTPFETSSVWLRNFVQSLQGTLAMHQRTLLVLTWDEGGEEDSRGNRVLTILLGDVVRPGRYDARLSHYSLLRTIENNFGLEPLADGDRNASAVPASVWRD
jgi:phosphoesterase family protein